MPADLCSLYIDLVIHEQRPETVELAVITCFKQQHNLPTGLDRLSVAFPAETIVALQGVLPTQAYHPSHALGSMLLDCVCFFKNSTKTAQESTAAVFGKFVHKVMKRLDANSSFELLCYTVTHSACDFAGHVASSEDTRQILLQFAEDRPASRSQRCITIYKQSLVDGAAKHLSNLLQTELDRTNLDKVYVAVLIDILEFVTMACIDYQPLLSLSAGVQGKLAGLNAVQFPVARNLVNAFMMQRVDALRSTMNMRPSCVRRNSK